ncbi:hypothetical protein Agabi119p4_3601 [Agaricus bisporus var. burnettii]|uniref:RING-type domain-containing protein n=1 Tax=Agaricus bisporus var. burnettii TaxID=192524 RepID=A0A8H7F547_AGABI|nr:hypothetical protein Agabi119p4_3601 [Agaricus bisporus var. burnettii]
MGNTSSSGGRGHHDESVDYGSLVPQGVYTGPRDWNHAIVSQLIVARKLAPFYRPLEDYEESWDDDQLLAARKELNPRPENSEQPSRSDSIHSLSSKSSSKRSIPNREQARPEAAVYRGAMECPICFLYYPSNINRSRCCDQAICTECFVQIKRNEPTATHLVSEPAACPFCVQDNFGIVYRPPLWKAGIGSDASAPSWPEPPKESTQPLTHRRRQKSYSADSPEVVTTDQIRPDWESKLAAVRAAVARRANRRIVMRQVGDRLIPVGVTSGRIHALNSEEVAEAAEGGGSRRRRRHGGNSQLEQFMSIPGQDLEELMLMEAMRLSLIEHEEQQRKEAEEKRKQEEEDAAATNARGSPSETGTSHVSGPQTISGSGSSTLATLPSNLSVQFSSEASLAAPSASQQSREPLNTGKPNSRSNSRSRASAFTTDHESSNGEPSNSRNQRTTNPPPFSALNAALASASTAAAILGNSQSSNQEAHTPVSPTARESTNPFLVMAQKEEQTRNLSPHNLTQTAPTSSDDHPQRPPVPLKLSTPSSPRTSQDRSDHGLNDQLSSHGHLASASNSEPFPSSQKRKSQLGADHITAGRDLRPLRSSC